MADLVSTAPAIYSAFLSLVTAAAAQQSPPAYVAPFELEQYEPASYIILSGIENQRLEIETLSIQSTFSMLEYYDLVGCCTVYVGDSPDALNPTVAVSVMNQTYALYNAAVLTPFLANRTAPVLGATSPYFPDGAVNYCVPGYCRYRGQPGNIGGAESGWSGVLDFSFSLRAYLTIS